MPGAKRPARPWERDGHEMTSRLGSVMEWRCGLPATSRDAATMLAACSPPGHWQRWRQATENDEEAHRCGPSRRGRRREQPGARRELGERLPWM